MADRWEWLLQARQPDASVTEAARKSRFQRLRFAKRRRTLARRIIDGAKEVNIFGEQIPVRAHIYTINGFSAHADQAELLAWQKQTGAKQTFLVHGEEGTMRSFATLLANTRVELPEPNQVFEL